tara:strand:- start:4291 stop:5241 length:951 start_codon:yes stop_codon:yes gene_type:complete
VFGVLPVVSGTDYLWIVIDPDASAGAPEIVKVTAHASASTTVTVSRGQQASVARAHLANVRVTNPVTKADLDSFVTGAADLVDDSIATAKLADDAITTAKINSGAVGLTELGSDVFTYSAGDIKQSIRDTLETGWLWLDGGVYAGANTLYPGLWAVAPSSWKSGTTLSLPNMTDRILQGPASGSSAGIGSTNGSNTVTLSTAHMPSHAHTMDHDHPSVSTSDTGAHRHLGLYVGADNGYATEVFRGGAAAFGTSSVNGSTTDSGHAGQGRHRTGSAGDHQHTLDVPNFTGSTGSIGSGSAFGIEQAALRVNYFIKT